MSKNLINSFIISIFFIGCSSSDEKMQKKQVGNFIVEAIFRSDSIIEGNATFYNLDGRLFSKIDFTNGLKNGAAVYFDEKANKIDSMNFNNGSKNGYQFSFDQQGRIAYVDYFYYNINVGPETYITNNITNNYSFKDFNRNSLVDCKYDSLGRLILVDKYSTNATILKKVYNGKEEIDFFAYLPHPPGLLITHNIGITNAEQQDEILFEINYKNQLFFDSLLPYPKDGYHYFIASHIKNYDSSINKVIIEEVTD